MLTSAAGKAVCDRCRLVSVQHGNRDVCWSSELPESQGCLSGLPSGLPVQGGAAWSQIVFRKSSCRWYNAAPLTALCMMRDEDSMLTVGKLS